MRRSYNNYNDQGHFRRGGHPNQQWPQDRNYDYRGNRGSGATYRGRGGSGPNFGANRGWHPRAGPGGSREYGGDRPTRRRVVARSTSHSRSRSRSPKSRSPRSRTQSSSNDEHDSRSRSPASRDHSRKHRHSSSDGSSHDRSSRKIKSNADNDDTKRNLSASDSSHSDDENFSPPPQSHKKKDKKKKKKVRSGNNIESPDREHSSKRNEEMSGSEDSDASSVDSQGPVMQAEEVVSSEDMPADEPAKPAVRTALRSTVQAAPVVRKAIGSKTPVDVEPPELSSSVNNPPRKVQTTAASTSADAELLKMSSQWKKFREDKQLEDIFSEKDLAQADRVRKVPSLQTLPNEDVLATDLFNQRTAENPSAMDNEPPSQEDRHFKMPHSVSLPFSGKKRRSTEDPKRQSDPTSIGVTDKEDSMKRPRNSAIDMVSAVKGAGMSSTNTSAASATKKKQTATDGGLWLPPDKMALVHEKKAEIEEAYKQDCETFATVTKMLISKDPGIEERIQLSLRENLKDIGQRCIQELRDYIEKLRTEQEEAA